MNKKIYIGMLFVSMLLVSCGGSSATDPSEANTDGYDPSEANTDGYDPSTEILTDVRDGRKYKTTKIGEQVWMAENLKYTTSGSMCYDGDLVNCEKYGRLYIWMDARKACPTGWHLPSIEEFVALLNNVGSSEDERSENLRAASWENGTDKFGFSALPAGNYYSYNEFGSLDSRAFFWSSTWNGSNSAHILHIYVFGASILLGYGKFLGHSVRCLQD